ncbi:hypothetical protein TNCV_2360881 [Trichonephila clavipes]|nr:hypothetical protein TNCV_2360881 [Trichonephila clavipes]
MKGGKLRKRKLNKKKPKQERKLINTDSSTSRDPVEHFLSIPTVATNKQRRNVPPAFPESKANQRIPLFERQSSSGWFFVIMLVMRPNPSSSNKRRKSHHMRLFSGGVLRWQLKSQLFAHSKWRHHR